MIQKIRGFMKCQGKVIHWNDDKDFGFFEPNGGKERAFVHIKAFRPGSRRPVNGNLIVYELVRENNNRYKAKNISFTADTKAVKNRIKKIIVPLARHLLRSNNISTQIE
jgi:cold shock CspA family protein